MRLKTKGVLTFLLIAFGLAWAAILVAQLLDLPLDNPLVQLPIAFSPAIAAVIVRGWVTREGFRDAGLRPRLRTAWRYYLVALAGLALVFVATVGLAIALGLYRPDFAHARELISEMGVPAPVVPLLLLAMPVLAAPIFWGEEFGWRSYLQRRVSRDPVRAALIVGVIWSVWHYPLVFTDYSEYTNPFLGIVTWTLGIVPKTVILAWLFLRSGSVWVPCIAHAGNNLVIGMLFTALLTDGGGLDPSTVDLLEFVPVAAIAAWIVLSGQLKAAAGAGEFEPAAEVHATTQAARRQ